MNILALIVIIVFAINILCVLAMIFIERKKPQIIVSWLVTMTFLPILGFILYVLIGSGLSYKTKRMLKTKRLYQKEYNDAIKAQKHRLSNKNFKDENEKELFPFLLFNLNNASSAYYKYNNVRLFTNGEDKITALKKDLLKAKHSINMLYYIFADDAVGNEILNILTQKAKEGVKVKLLFDSVGSLKTKKHFFKPLVQAGGEIAEFFPPLFGIRLVNLKLNYRNHRKIVVIDGKIAYTGGINIRDDHMGRSKKLRPWRDTHLRLTGQVVSGFQSAFFNDWRFCKKLGPNFSELFEKGYFVESKSSNKLGMQIISSGPDDDDAPIKEAFLKMILSAKERIVIQSPYFIPDETLLSALNIARMSGVKIDIMIPGVPDKKIVYMATLSYIKELLKCGEGINVYLYNGFLHSKMIMIDNSVVSIGTCNFDNRSFALNFEINTFIYGKEFAEINNNIFNKDISNSTKIDLSYFARKPWYSRLAQAFFRLFSPLL
ncbi:MAG: cardiolipin synthase [Clostridia bacterium]|nr:cardiolipin synthase [Clostridia bacterium]